MRTKEFERLKDNPGNYFMAYLVNTSDSAFIAKRQDGSLIMIQEAMDDNGEWKPIEYWVNSGCGNSYHHPLKLDPGKYVMIPIKQYQGKFKTRFRLKLKTARAIFYSEVFEGSMERSQFERKMGNVRGILYNGPANYLD